MGRHVPSLRAPSRPDRDSSPLFRSSTCSLEAPFAADKAPSVADRRPSRAKRCESLTPEASLVPDRADREDPRPSTSRLRGQIRPERADLGTVAPDFFGDLLKIS